MTTRIVVGSILLSTLVHGVAWACSCLPVSEPLEDLVDSHDLVAYGEVRSVRRPLIGCGGGAGPENHVRIEVIEGYVGAEEGEVVTVTTSASDASCGVPFEEGETWLVFASGADNGVGLCGPSRRTSDDDPVLDELRDLVP